MEDNEIIRLYWEREEQAIAATAQKYGSYFHKIAMNILQDTRDAEECVSDAYMRAWNSIPPNHPERLSTYLGKITRNIAFDVYRQKHRDKRGNGQIALIMDEVSELIGGGEEPEKIVNRKELISEINSFLSGLPKEKRVMFVRRYWYAENTAEIAHHLGRTENYVSVNLTRLRKRLRSYLAERGYEYEQ